MAVKIPRFCISHTVEGTATIRAHTSAADWDVTFPSRRYWLDPVYQSGGFTSLNVTDSVCLIGQLVYLLTANGTDAQTYTAAYQESNAADELGINMYLAASSNIRLDSDHANVTEGGRDVLHALGLPTHQKKADAGGQIADGDNIGVWTSPRGESGILDEPATGYGAIFRTSTGVVYTADLGIPLLDRMVRISLVKGKYAIGGRGSEIGGYDNVDEGEVSFDRLIWQRASRGEVMRYYRDKNAASTYLTAAVAKTDAKITVAATTGLTSKVIYVNGEKMLAGTASGLDINVTRNNPQTHSKYDPVSADLVGTYALAKGGGNVNMAGCHPKLRGEGGAGGSADYWDMDISLVRAV